MWFWLNIPLVRLFVCCWAGITVWLMLARWNAEISAKHAAIAAKASPALVFVQSDPALTQETGSPAHAGVAGPLGRQFPVWLRLPSEPGCEPVPPVAAGARRGPGIRPRNTGCQPQAGTARTERTCHEPP